MLNAQLPVMPRTSHQEDANCARQHVSHVDSLLTNVYIANRDIS